jgi:hypothetical protein
MAVLDSAVQEADIATAREVLGRADFPPELLLQSIEAGEDSAGDPVLRIVVAVRLTHGDLPERGRMRELTKFINDKVGEILAAGVESWPLFRLTEIPG